MNLAALGVLTGALGKPGTGRSPPRENRDWRPEDGMISGCCFAGLWGLNTDDPVWVPTVFTHNRDRLLEGEDFNPPDTPS